MKKISAALILSGACSLASLNNLDAQTIASAGKSSQNNSVQSANPANTSKRIIPDSPGLDKRATLREAILPLLRAVFNARWKGHEVLLTVDAGWRNDSLSIEYKYYKGNNLLALDENLLVEKIYFTFKPEEIDALDTENDEFRFLYLRNKKKRLNIHQLISRPSAGVNEETWCSSFGFPVRTENLASIIQVLKDLRTE